MPQLRHVHLRGEAAPRPHRPVAREPDPPEQIIEEGTHGPSVAVPRVGFGAKAQPGDAYKDEAVGMGGAGGLVVGIARWYSDMRAGAEGECTKLER